MSWSPKILIVDDEPRICESLSQLLKARNYIVTTAISGQEALELIAKFDFDLAILDVHLSDMSGTRLMDAIKVRDLNTAVIIISGDADIDSALDALRFGAYDYLRKPGSSHKSVQKFGHLKVSKAVIKSSNVHVRRAVSISSMADHFRLIIKTFNHAVIDSKCKVGQQSLFVPPEHPGKVTHGL